MKLSLIIPAHNEEKRIGRTLDVYGAYFRNLKKSKKIDFEILVVLNACSDRTDLVVKKHSFKEVRVLNFERGGKGFAVMEGFKDVLKRNNDLIGFVDADLATPPQSMYEVFRALENADVAIASRAHPDSKIQSSLIRKITSRGFNTLVRALLLLPYRDTQCGAKAFSYKALKTIFPELAAVEWTFDIDLLYKARKNGFSIVEVPTTWTDQKGSKLNLKRVPLQMFASVLRFRLLNSPLKSLIKIYDRLPESVKIHKISPKKR